MNLPLYSVLKNLTKCLTASGMKSDSSPAPQSPLQKIVAFGGLQVIFRQHFCRKKQIRTPLKFYNPCEKKGSKIK